MTIYNLYIFEPCYIQNHVINRLWCTKIGCSLCPWVFRTVYLEIIFLNSSLKHLHVYIDTKLFIIFIPRHTIVAGYYGFTLVLRESVHPSVIHLLVHPSIFRFRMITWVNTMDFHQTCYVHWYCGLGLLMGKFRQIFTELSAWDTPIFSFSDYNLSK